MLEKVQNRLAGWKVEHFSMAGRTLLVQSVTSSSLPTYTMQTTRIPESVNQEIEKLNCKFVWGSNETKKKIHLVSWEKLCSSKEEGGLGLRSMGLMNKALMARMGWKFVTEPDSLWASILGSKYLNNSSFFNCEANSKSSYTWRSILKGKDILKMGSKWVILNGQRAKFWLDWWIGEGPLVL